MVFLYFIHPESYWCCIPVFACHVMIYGKLNPDMLSSFYALSLSDGIYVFTNFCLGVFSTLDVFKDLLVRLFCFSWKYFYLVGIYFNAMYYFHPHIDCLTHCDCGVIILCNGYGNKESFECAVNSTLLTGTIRSV